MGLRIDIVTIFPGYFGSPLGVSLIGKAAARGDIEFGVHDLRRWAADVHHTVDDVPFGGGPGMVMKPDVWGDALDEIIPTADGTARLVVPTPSGVPFSQDIAARYATESRLVFACGRYEGIDGRVVEAMRARMPVDEVSIGDYVLAGGEAAALVMIEAVGRLVPESWVTRPRRGTTRSAVTGNPRAPCAGCSRVPFTPGRGPGASARCPRCCCRATMPRSRAGVVTWRSAGPPRTGPTSSRR